MSHLRISRYMLRSLLLLLILLSALPLWAQRTSATTTYYPTFRPATIHMRSGEEVKTMANVFLKNSSLVYRKGSITMRANMKLIDEVSFDDQRFVCLDTLLTTIVDTVGKLVLYRASVIDIEAFRRMENDNRQITNIDIGDFVNYSSVDLNAASDLRYPLVDTYYIGGFGKLLLAEERRVAPKVTKEKRRLYETLITLPEFSWTNPESLLRIMKDCLQ